MRDDGYHHYKQFNNRAPFLVQRTMRNDYVGPRSKNGIDSVFGFDYMGSSEFEYGTLPAALKVMRTEKDQYVTKPKRMKTSGGKIVWYVGPVKNIVQDVVAKFFEDQVTGKNTTHLKERSGIKDSYNDNEEEGRRQPDAWWCVDDKALPWVFFKSKKHANEWIEACWSGPTKT